MNINRLNGQNAPAPTLAMLQLELRQTQAQLVGARFEHGQVVAQLQGALTGVQGQNAALFDLVAALLLRKSEGVDTIDATELQRVRASKWDLRVEDGQPKGSLLVKLTPKAPPVGRP